MKQDDTTKGNESEEHTNAFVYKGLVLMKGSTALELWLAWQKETKDRPAAQKKLDLHMKDIFTRHKELLEKY